MKFPLGATGIHRNTLKKDEMVDFSGIDRGHSAQELNAAAKKKDKKKGKR